MGLDKNQRPPAEVAPALPGTILIPPALLVVADFSVDNRWMYNIYFFMLYIQLQEGKWL
jgi:hypothetical protein